MSGTCGPNHPPGQDITCSVERRRPIAEAVSQGLQVYLRTTSVSRQGRRLTGSTWLANGSQAGKCCTSRSTQLYYRSCLGGQSCLLAGSGTDGANEFTNTASLVRSSTSGVGQALLDKRRMALGDRRKSRHDRDNHLHPAGCETSVRRWEKADRIGENRG